MTIFILIWLGTANLASAAIVSKLMVFCTVPHTQILSPNFGERPASVKPDMVILHYTGMPDAIGALQRLCAPEAEVSCHYLIHENGAVVQLVAENYRAWHAGVSYWRGERDINSRSIGIELVNPGHDFGYRDFPLPQLQALVALLKDISSRYVIAPENYLAHSDVAPRRKMDPGEKFPWAWLAQQGFGRWVTVHLCEDTSKEVIMRSGDIGRRVEDLQKKLSTYGYELPATGTYDEATQAVVTAFQRHFRPEKVDGVADGKTLATIKALTNGLGAA